MMALSHPQSLLAMATRFSTARNTEAAKWVLAAAQSSDGVRTKLAPISATVAVESSKSESKQISVEKEMFGMELLYDLYPLR